MSIHNRRDVTGPLKITTALPAAAANNNSASIDLGANRSHLDHIEVEVAIPATPALTEATTIITTLQDSADNSSFAAIPELATIVVTGAASAAGGPATTRTVRLPSSVRRYLRENSAVLTGAGSNIAVSRTLSVLF